MFAEDQASSLAVVPAAREETSRSSWRLPVLICFCCVALSAGSFTIGRSLELKAHAARPSAFQLTPKFDGENVEIAWPATAAEIREAQRGLLVIVDGATANRVELSSAALRAGRYQYSPHSPSLSFVLTVYRDNNNFAGASADLTGITAPDEPSELDAPPAVSSPTAAEVKPKKAGADGGTELQEQRVAREFVAPPELRASISVPQVSAPPDLANSTSPGPVNLPRPNTVISPPPARPRPPVVPPQVELSSAVAVRRVTPRAPTLSAGTLRDSVLIHVRVGINSNGKVVSAKPVELENGFDRRLLASSAVEAAKEWRFEPARRNGVPVASETVLEFRFNRE